MTTALNWRCSFSHLFFRMAYTYCYGLIGNTFESFVEFLEMHVGKNVLEISNTLVSI